MDMDEDDGSGFRRRGGDGGGNNDDGSSSSSSNSNGDDTALVFLNCNGFREAVDDLENPSDRRPVYNLFVRRRDGNDADADDDDARVFFPRFVDLLGRGRRQQREGGTEGGGGGRVVQDIHFMVDWSVLPISDMERLFGTVLPAHDTLQGIAIDISGLPTTYLRMLTESLPTSSSSSPRTTGTSLSSLRLMCSAGALDPTTQADVAHAIADMLIRNVSLRDLIVDAPLKIDAFSRIGCALRVGNNNTNLEHLSLHVNIVSAEALQDLGSSASLRFLHVSATMFADDDAVEALATQLRTNVTLQNLLLTVRGGHSIRGCRALIDLVKTYNYKLDGIYGGMDDTTVVDGVPVRHVLDLYLRRNRHIRSVMRQLRRAFGSTAPRSSSARVGGPAGSSSSSTSLLKPLLPLVLGPPVSDHLNALFRVLKMDFVIATMGRHAGKTSEQQVAGNS